MPEDKKEKLDEIEEKKKELQAELDRIQKELDTSFDEVRSDVSHKLKPSEIIKNHPIPVVGLSVLVGFLVSYRSSSSKSASSSASGSSGDGFTSLLMKELKKLATRKAVSVATDYIDQFLESKKEETLTGTNGTEESE